MQGAYVHIDTVTPVAGSVTAPVTNSRGVCHHLQNHTSRDDILTSFASSKVKSQVQMFETKDNKDAKDTKLRDSRDKDKDKRISGEHARTYAEATHDCTTHTTNQLLSKANDTKDNQRSANSTPSPTKNPHTIILLGRTTTTTWTARARHTTW